MPKAMETVKRLDPTKDTLRVLFLQSANLCAYPGCNRSIMLRDGTFVGQLCHIEAAEEGGQRFNALMTNEERRQPANLVLMCYDHHVVTNDVEKWTVERMQELKAGHEKTVYDFLDNVQIKIVDFTALEVPKPAATISKLSKLWKDLKLDADEISYNIRILNSVLERVKKLPRPVRELLAVIVSKVEPRMNGSYVSYSEIELACNKSSDDLIPLLGLLDKYRFVSFGGYNEFDQPEMVLYNLEHGWDLWKDFRELEVAGEATLHELIVNMNFKMLD